MNDLVRPSKLVLRRRDCPDLPKMVVAWSQSEARREEQESRGYQIRLFVSSIEIQPKISADKLPKVSPIAKARAPKPSRKNTKVLVAEPKRTGC